MNKTKNLIEKSENKEDIVLTIPALLELQKQIEEISRNINNQLENNLFFNIWDWFWDKLRTVVNGWLSIT